MKLIFCLILLSIILLVEGRKCPCESKPPACPIGEIYLERGPGPFCYQTCW